MALPTPSNITELDDERYLAIRPGALHALLQSMPPEQVAVAALNDRFFSCGPAPALHPQSRVDSGLSAVAFEYAEPTGWVVVVHSLECGTVAAPGPVVVSRLILSQVQEGVGSFVFKSSPLLMNLLLELAKPLSFFEPLGESSANLDLVVSPTS